VLASDVVLHLFPVALFLSLIQDIHPKLPSDELHLMLLDPPELVSTVWKDPLEPSAPVISIADISFGTC
jgi:hypothetical protein